MSSDQASYHFTAMPEMVPTAVVTLQRTGNGEHLELKIEKDHVIGTQHIIHYDGPIHHRLIGMAGSYDIRDPYSVSFYRKGFDWYCRGEWLGKEEPDFLKIAGDILGYTPEQEAA